MKQILIFNMIILFLVGAGLFSDSHQDTLPIGPSPYKYDLGKIEKNQIYETGSGKIVNLSDLVRAAGSADLIVIGESHDNYDCHVFQKDLIEALYQKYPRIIVGFEFFKREDDEALELWRNGQISESELIRKTGWYQKTSYNYGYTRLIMDVLKKYRIKTIGLNVSRDILRKVSRKGFDSLSPDEKKLFPGIKVSHPQHRYLIKTIFGDFALQVPFWFENVYDSQKCWDVVMAESMRQTLAKREFRGYKGIIIAGSFHVAYHLGIPFRFQRSDKRARLTTIMPVLIPTKDKESDPEEHPMKKMFAKNLPAVAVFSRGIGDYVFSITTPPHSHFPELGFSCKKINDTIQIAAIKKKGLAEKYGLKKGDIIVMADGENLKTMEQLRSLLASKEWGGDIRLRLDRKIELKKKENKRP